MLGYPVAGETEPIGGLRQRHGGGQRVAGGLVGAHRDEIEDGKTHAGVNAPAPANLPGARAPEDQ
ncbi:hypothetical protein [Mycobacterium avium]|uniref:hypothetical protein n=1 Tax=Mycobacterium avium TaxID=1764 RepID=UPI001CDB0278|nr:hypothetical protein [Mycobacterium avium]